MNKKVRQSLPALQKIINLILSKDTVSIIHSIAEEDQNNESESALNLPEVEECLNILREALSDRFYEPFVLISKRILRAISGLIDISEIELGSINNINIENSDIINSDVDEEVNKKVNSSLDEDFTDLIKMALENLESWQSLYG